MLTIVLCLLVAYTGPALVMFATGYVRARRRWAARPGLVRDAAIVALAWPLILAPWRED